LFMKSMACPFFEEAKVLHTKQFNSNDHENSADKKVRESLPNYCFYKDEADKPKSVSSLHSKFQNYQFLEGRHDYIQWMFPNHYGSAFNSRAFPLTYLEKRLFLDDNEVGLRLLTSLYIFLDFLGVRLDLASLQLTVCSQQRMKAAVLVHTHNHLRLMRLLACLSVTGFRQQALAIISLLDQLTSPDQFLQEERREFEISWKIYGEE
jgi:hypothetical protein